MPLNKVLGFLRGNRSVFETVFWIAVLVFAYFAMSKAMHPGIKIFGF
ncbi:hypothetical protein HY989_05440 [Candidatus Micrarchaeota archaeon]|nr:hypothetical protein [Candidatus Micrarchaeota archaeon]